MTTPDTDIEPRYDTNGDPAEPDTLANLPVDHLHPADDNPRQHLGDLTELAATITAHGIIEPLVVHPRNIGGGWTIVAGHRRHAAAQHAGLTHVPCVIRHYDTREQRLETMAIENLQRVDLTPLDEARAYQQLTDLGHSQRQIADRVGRNQSHISKRLKLGRLPNTATTLLTAGRLTIRQAEQLADLPDTDIDDVAAEVARHADSWHGEDTELPAWIADQAIQHVARNRKHAAAEATGEASGLKRLKQRPWDGASDHRPCKKTDATHWYLAERDTTIIWARTAKADAKARAVTGDQPATEQPWERNQRIRAEVSERRADLLDRLPPAKLAELAIEWIFTQFDADRAVSLHPITFSAGADPLDVICYAALERVRDDATQEPSSTESWGWPIWDLWQRVAAAVAELDTPAVDEPAAGDEHADDAPGITHNATIPIAITLPEHLANAVHDLVEAQPSTATRPPWSTYNGRNDGDLCVTISQVKSPDKLLHALAYEIANRDGKHGRRGIVGTLIARINEVMGQ